MKNGKVAILLLLVIGVCILAWFGIRHGWFGNTRWTSPAYRRLPQNNPPTLAPAALKSAFENGLSVTLAMTRDGNLVALAALQSGALTPPDDSRWVQFRATWVIDGAVMAKSSGESVEPGGEWSHVLGNDSSRSVQPVSEVVRDGNRHKLQYLVRYWVWNGKPEEGELIFSGEAKSASVLVGGDP